MLPRTEYNVNSCNKYLDFVVGDYIAQITIKNINKQVKKDNGKPNKLNNWDIYPDGEQVLTISEPIFQGGLHATATVNIVNGYIQSKTVHVTSGGQGYSYSQPPSITIPDSNFTSDNFSVIVGVGYVAQLREGQYKIGGNPQMSNNTTPPPASVTAQQSWVPMNLVAEIENALSYAILKDNSDFTGISPAFPAGTTPNAETYCYGRIPWTSIATVGSPILSSQQRQDYPLLFTTRILSQYPSVDAYYDGVRDNIDNFETNSCRFNRLYITNVLIFRTPVGTSHVLGQTVPDGLHFYTVLKVDDIPGGGQIIYCSLNDALANPSWIGTTLTPAHWEFLFANGENQILNSASLLGYNKKNYYHSILDKPTELPFEEAITNAIRVNYLPGSSLTTLVPRGITYSTENDYYLFGDPEYIVLSFRPKIGGSSISGINDRVDSNPNSNIDRVFACLIFDGTFPAVLEGVTSGQMPTILNSTGATNNSQHSYITEDHSFKDVLQLIGNTGTLQSERRPPGQLKAMKGADFDRKLIEFIQPIAQISQLNVRFTKFTKNLNAGDDRELYDFHGKEHLLLFEITCGDLMTA